MDLRKSVAATSRKQFRNKHRDEKEEYRVVITDEKGEEFILDIADLDEVKRVIVGEFKTGDLVREGDVLGFVPSITVTEVHYTYLEHFLDIEHGMVNGWVESFETPLELVF